MYGAYWCPHCNDQKALFGVSWKKIDYIECSLPGGQGQKQECTVAGITGYPTWEFSDGTRESRVLSLEELADKEGCPLSDRANAGEDSRSVTKTLSSEDSTSIESDNASTTGTDTK